MKHLLRVASLCLLSVIGAPAAADRDRDAYVEANVVAIFYHEFAHAVIDLMGVPIYGQEEDAADVMAVLLIDRLFEENDAQSLARDSAFGFIDDPEGQYEVAYWDVHGPDEQRYFNHVCLFYGADPDGRRDLSKYLELPDERAETCAEEFEIAADSWEGVFEELASGFPGRPMVFVPGRGRGAGIANRVVGAEVDRLNRLFALPEDLRVAVEPCGEANAFYSLDEIEIVMCTELVAHLEKMYDRYWRD